MTNRLDLTHQDIRQRRRRLTHSITDIKSQPGWGVSKAEQMSNHDDDFWGDEATWSSRPTPNEGPNDGSDDAFDAKLESTFEDDRVGPLEIVRTCTQT